MLRRRWDGLDVGLDGELAALDVALVLRLELLDVLLLLALALVLLVLGVDEPLLLGL